MAMSGSWFPQGVEEQPDVYGSVVVDGVPYLIAGRDGSSDATVIEVNSDGTFTEYSFPTSELPTRKSVALAGTKIVITEENNGTFAVHVDIFDTVSKTFTQASTIVAWPGVTGARWAGGALGSDGLVYFPPVRNNTTFAAVLPLVYDPATDGLSYTDFGGTWVSGYGWGGAVMGGDGLMYFLPGYYTNGAGINGGFVGVLDFSTMTFSTISVPSSETGAIRTTWAAPAPDGIYLGLYWAFGIYKVTSAGFTQLSSASPFESGYDSSQGSLSTQVDILGAVTVGDDGKVYVVGSTFQSSTSFVPVVVVVNPADDSVHFEEFSSLTGHKFVPSAAYPFDGGIVSLTLYISGGTYPDAFYNSLYRTGAWSFAVGAVPVNLALGANAMTGVVG